MSSSIGLSNSRRRPAAETATWLMIAVQAAIVAVPASITSFGAPAGPATGSPFIAYPLAAAILFLQLRHSLASARDERPRGGTWTFLLLAGLVYLPVPVFGWDWISISACVMASGTMLLPGWLRPAAVVLPLVGIDVAVVKTSLDQGAGYTIYEVCYWTFSVFMAFVGLYASGRLLRLLRNLHEARAELAEMAIGQERLRISRDLHDLLGHSLSAVALKGDLAIRLLRRDPVQALTEIESLTELARDAHRGIRAVSRNEYTVSLRSEGEAAAALLAAAGINAQIDLNLEGLPLDLQPTLAWAVREGVANTLRHSQARRCSITVSRRDGNVCLAIVNDGVLDQPAEGTGLTGLAERARALAGSSSFQTSDGEFRLLIRLPERT